MTEREYDRSCSVKSQVLDVYSANVPSALGSADPLRGALSIASGVNWVVLAAFTEKMLESRRAAAESGDRMMATILNVVSLRGIQWKET